MKIHELSKLTNINNETLRLYREKGFLHPEKLDNGYYEYSMEDFTNIVYLRKFREYGLSLSDIFKYEHSSATEEILQMLDYEQQTIEQQIELLKERQKFLKLEQSHILESDQVSNNGAMLQQSTDDKYDYYGNESIQKFIREWNSSSFYLTTTSSIRIPKDVLNGEIKDQEIEIENGIGTYGYMLRRKNMPITEKAVVVPNGLCISQSLKIRDFKKINIKQLEPMMSLSKKLNKPFLSDTTGYLSCIRYDENGPVFFYRIRACVEENSIREE